MVSATVFFLFEFNDDAKTILAEIYFDFKKCKLIYFNNK
jgi:hypothetical protein